MTRFSRPCGGRIAEGKRKREPDASANSNAGQDKRGSER